MTMDEPYSLITTSQLEENNNGECVFANMTLWPTWSVSTGSTALYHGKAVTLCHSLPSPELARMSDQDPQEASPAETPPAAETTQDTAPILRQQLSEGPGSSPDLVSSVTSVTRQPPVSRPPVECPPHYACVEVPTCYEILAAATARPRSPLTDSLIGTHLSAVSGLAFRNRAYSEYEQQSRVEKEKYSYILPKRSSKEFPTEGPPWTGTPCSERPRTIGGNSSAVITPVWPPRPAFMPPPGSTLSPPQLEVRQKSGHQKLHSLNKPPPDARLKHKKNQRKAEYGAPFPLQSNSSQIQNALRTKRWNHDLPQGIASTLLQAENLGWGPKQTLDSLILCCGNKTWRPPPIFTFASEIKKPKTKKHPSIVLFNPVNQVQEMDMDEMDQLKHKGLLLWNCICSPGVAPELEEAAFVTLVQYALLSIKNWRDALTDRPADMTQAQSDNDKDAALFTGLLLDSHPWFSRSRKMFQGLHDGNLVSTIIFRDMAFQARYFMTPNWSEAIAAEYIRLTKLGL